MAIIKISTEDLVSVQDAAKELNRPRLAIYRMVERDELNGIKLGGILYIPTSEIERIKIERTKKGGDKGNDNDVPKSE
ncbi:MAG: helix-turn-helix domain-containing protein [Dehalococcoidales bacterium]|nr:helix-turn-helix domain-containing protein [Dehalococcoidales bacterium]